MGLHVAALYCFIARLLGETKIIERFTEHDLRGKVGSDAESLERARQLLGHADSKITERVYRRKKSCGRYVNATTKDQFNGTTANLRDSAAFE